MGKRDEITRQQDSGGVMEGVMDRYNNGGMELAIKL